MAKSKTEKAVKTLSNSFGFKIKIIKPETQSILLYYSFPMTET